MELACQVLAVIIIMMLFPAAVRCILLFPLLVFIRLINYLSLPDNCGIASDRHPAYWAHLQTITNGINYDCVCSCAAGIGKILVILVRMETFCPHRVILQIRPISLHRRQNVKCRKWNYNMFEIYMYEFWSVLRTM